MSIRKHHDGIKVKRGEKEADDQILFNFFCGIQYESITVALVVIVSLCCLSELLLLLSRHRLHNRIITAQKSVTKEDISRYFGT